MLTKSEILKQIKNGTITITSLQTDALKPNSCSLHLPDFLYKFPYQVIDTKKQHRYLRELMTDQLDTLEKLSIPKDGLLLEPHKLYLAKTSETVHTNGFIPVLHGKTSLSLLGVSIELTSGYETEHFHGAFPLSIVATKPTIIYPNIEIGNLTFFRSLNTNNHTIGMLSGEEIKRRLQTGEIEITPQDNIVINPNSVNLTLFSEIGYYTSPILDLKQENPIARIPITENGIILYPNDVYLGISNEWTNTPKLIPMMSGRSSLGRLGFHVHCSGGMGDIGYKGYWHLGIRTTIPITIFSGMKCCQLYYYTPDGEITDSYQGSMQGLKEDIVGSQFYKKLK